MTTFLGGGGVGGGGGGAGGGTSPTSGGNRAPGGLPPSSSAAAAALSSLSAAPDHHAGGMRQGPVRGGRASLTASRSAPTGSMAGSCPPQDLPARAKSLGDIGFQESAGGGGGGGSGHMGFYPGGAAMADSMGNGLIGVGGGGVAGERRQHEALHVRGPLPMTLDRRSKAHLRTFMRTVGSLVLLPGNDAIRGAVFGDVCDSEEMTDAAAADSAAAGGGSGDSGAAGSGGGAESDSKAGGATGGQPTAGDGDGSNGGVVDAFAEACRAEAWAAAAVGAQFSGAREQEGKEYVSRALRSMSRCLDAPLPEVRGLLYVCMQHKGASISWCPMKFTKLKLYFSASAMVVVCGVDGIAPAAAAATAAAALF